MSLASAFAEGSIAVAVLAADRDEAIRASGELLVASGRTTIEYTEQMLAAVEEFGPYIVIAPQIALAHARPSEAVLETGLSLAVLADGVAFGSPNDPVRLVFGLAAKDHDGHISVLSALAERLSDQDFVNSLLNASTSAQIGALLSVGSAE
jgi:PTS system ascorbate-specific IIA component